jgi:DNA-binding MarR family transcriptional regulator
MWMCLTNVREVSEVVAMLRGFNRSFTQRIGVLDESFLGAGRPLGQARLLYEIGLGHGSVLGLRQRLGLDSGYLSRLLRVLENERLVEVGADPGDGRRRTVKLTPLGGEAWDDLDRRSEELANRIVDPLNERQRDDLAAALATADRLLRAATITFDVVDPEDPAALTALGAYFEELDDRFVGGFDPGDTLTADAPSMRAPTGTFVVAHSDDQPVACGGVVGVDEASGEIKRMWVHPEWRGVGLGRRMLRQLESHVARLGHTRVVLDTNAVLTEAITMYERAGYTAIDRYNDNPYAMHWFARDLGGSPGEP